LAFGVWSISEVSRSLDTLRRLTLGAAACFEKSPPANAGANIGFAVLPTSRIQRPAMVRSHPLDHMRRQMPGFTLARGITALKQWLVFRDLSPQRNILRECRTVIEFSRLATHARSE
jgi:hypothetical protein